MNSIAWWPTVGMLICASVIDVRTRRIPNWLVVPFLVAGAAVRAGAGGLGGLGTSVSGILLACSVLGLFYWLGGMGMGDVKLAASIGAWVGPAQLTMALLVSAMVGGVMAIVSILWRRAAQESLDSTADLVGHLIRRPLTPHATIKLGGPKAISIPYAPAIAIGTLFSFFAS